MNRKMADVARRMTSGDFEDLKVVRLSPPEARGLVSAVEHDPTTFRDLITSARTGETLDWNLGFLLPHVDGSLLHETLSDFDAASNGTEGLAWGLGESRDDSAIVVQTLFDILERSEDYDAWWCAADALEKLGKGDATDLKKRTLRGVEWDSLEFCLAHLGERPAVIGVLRCATLQTTDADIVPACRAALRHDDWHTVRNAVWLLERLRVSDADTLRALEELYARAEDVSNSLRPRIVEALGQIAALESRELLEQAVKDARYFRTREYAARGLGRIGDSRSLPVLKHALIHETDEAVLPSLSDAIYAIENDAARRLALVIRDCHWPENGMVADETNKWYGAPSVYDTFARAEDPQNVSLHLALAWLPREAEHILELGAGTGRLTHELIRSLPGLKQLDVLDYSSEMLQFLQESFRFLPRARERINCIHAPMESIPLADASVDAVISAWAFPSRMWDLDQAHIELREVRRVLRPGGVLVTLGWDEHFRDELSELWYRYVPEPDFRRETLEQWRARRRNRVHSPRNCNLNFVARNLRVPLLFDAPEDAALTIGYLFGHSAGEWVASQRRTEFSINVGITADDTVSIDRALRNRGAFR